MPETFYYDNVNATITGPTTITVDWDSVFEGEQPVTARPNTPYVDAADFAVFNAAASDISHSYDTCQHLQGSVDAVLSHWARESITNVQLVRLVAFAGNLWAHHGWYTFIDSVRNWLMNHEGIITPTLGLVNFTRAWLARDQNYTDNTVRMLNEFCITMQGYGRMTFDDNIQAIGYHNALVAAGPRPTDGPLDTEAPVAEVAPEAVEVEEAGAYAYANDSRGRVRFRRTTEHLPEELRNEGYRTVRIRPGHTDYIPALRQAFDFIRRDGGQRYTDRTLMAITRAADMAETMDADRILALNLPVVYFTEAPYSFDELTEEKRGGIVAAGVVITNDEDVRRGVLAVRADMRRKGLATHMLTYCLNEQVVLYVHNRNAPAIALATKLGWVALSVSQTGVMKFSRTGYEEDDYYPVYDEDEDRVW